MKKPIKIILITLGASLLLLLAVVGLFTAGMFVWTSQAKTAVTKNPVVRAHFGEINDIDFEIMRSLETEGEDTLIFTITGDKGKGLVEADFVTVDDDHEKITKGTLTLENGEIHSLISPSEL